MKHRIELWRDAGAESAAGGVALLLASVLLPACRYASTATPAPSAAPAVEPMPALASRGAGVGDEIVVAGQRFAVGVPVVLWSDPGGFDAYDESSPPERAAERGGDAPHRRYAPGRVAPGPERRILVPPGGESILELARAVDLAVVHYDVCGTSARCFDVLHRLRGLSAHFLLDVDGTIYQTLDARETAWHAGPANARSVGIEIAHIGAYSPAESAILADWYAEDERGTRLALRPELAATVRTKGYAGRPARPGPIEGRIHGGRLVQHDFTPEQYDSLARLLAALCRALPRILPDAPRDAAGRVRMDALSEEELARFSGILGHHHVTRSKIDPGPAFDWERVLAAVRAPLGAAP